MKPGKYIFQEEPVKQNEFFCMKLVGFIMRDKCSYQETFDKARGGDCPYKGECEIYRRTVARVGNQLALF